MGSPYIGEIRMFAGNFAPAGWEFCDGQLLPIAENDALFTLIGTTYGGDGQNTFGLPNLQSRVPVHQGTGTALPNRTIGEFFGVEQVTLTVQQIPAHSHGLPVKSGTATSDDPTGNVVAGHPSEDTYHGAAPDTAMSAAGVAPAGSSQPHENVQPSLPIRFIISLFGIYPSPT